MERRRKLEPRRLLSTRLELVFGNSYNNAIWAPENGKTGACPKTIRKIAEVPEVDPAQLIREGK